MRSSYWSSESRESARSITMNCSKLRPSRTLPSLLRASAMACRNAASTCAERPDFFSWNLTCGICGIES